jgi:hypothetical protein
VNEWIDGDNSNTMSETMRGQGSITHFNHTAAEIDDELLKL